MTTHDNTGRESGPTSRDSAALGSNTKFVFTAEKTVEKYYLLHLAKRLMPDNRIRICMAHIQHGKTGVDLMRSEEYQYAWLSNLQRCGLGWICAFCSTRKSEQDRAVMVEAITTNMDRFIPMLVTLTMAHYPSEQLKDLLIALGGAYRVMQQCREWKLFVEDIMLEGTIRALEVTHSNSHGWHCHYHVLWLLNREILAVARDLYGIGLSDVELIEEIARAARNTLSTYHWRPALVSQGRHCTDERGVTVSVGHSEIIGYIAKYGYMPENNVGDYWDIESELTRHSAKTAKSEGRTTWDLLRDYGEGDKRAGALFVEFALATKGLNQLRWSPGLKEKLGVTDELEERILEEEPDNSWLMLWINSEQWKVIRRNRAQGELIRIASEGTPLEVMQWMNSLPGMKEAGEWFIPNPPTG